VSGLFPVAVALAVVGAAALAGSFAVPSPAARTAAPRPVDARREVRPVPQPARRRGVPEQSTAPLAATSVMPRTRSVEPTAEMPVTGAAQPASGDPAPSERAPSAVDEGDALWDFYSSGPTSR
jgi:hypothetical protein